MLQANAKFGNKFNMVLSEKVEKDGKNEFQEIAKVDVPCPILADFGIDAEVKQEEGKDVIEDGLPVYTSEALNWLLGAVQTQVKAQARNKFIKGELKPGMKLAETFEELVAVGERSGEALKARHEARKSFAAFLEGLNKPANVVKLLSDLFHDVNSIVTARDEFANALGKYIAQWIPSLSESDKVRYTGKIQSLQEALNSRTATLEGL